MLHLRDIRKAYRAGSPPAVDGLSLEIQRGEIFGLLGPNGAGKSTTISITVGLLKPDSGSVDIKGLGSPMDPGVRRLIGIAPQAIALYDELTADENLRLFTSLYSMSPADSAKAIDGVLARVGLSDRRKDRVATYSGGMKRRLNLTAALLHSPPLVLLDEPTAGVDPQSRSAILDEVRALRDAGHTVVYTTHYMEEAQRLCDRVAVIDKGKVLAIGTVQELIAQHGGDSTITVQTAAGETKFASRDPVADLTERLRDKSILNVRIDRPDLEAVFLNLTGRSLRD